MNSLRIINAVQDAKRAVGFWLDVLTRRRGLHVALQVLRLRRLENALRHTHDLVEGEERFHEESMEELRARLGRLNDAYQRQRDRTVALYLATGKSGAAIPS